MEKLLSDLKKHLKKHRDSPPKITYNKNDKHISVTHNFNHGFIPGVRLRADRETWLEWYYRPERITYETVEDYLSRTSKDTKAKLKQYALEYPQDFDSDIRYCVSHTLDHTKHPGSDKPRGGSPYGLSRKEMDDIQNTTRHLYICLKNNLKKPAYKQPQGLKLLLKLHGIEPDEKKLREITLQIIERVFDFKLSISELDKIGLGAGSSPCDVFYTKYIAYRPLKNLLNSKRINSFIGSPYLFKALIKTLATSCKLYLIAHK